MLAIMFLHHAVCFCSCIMLLLNFKHVGHMSLNQSAVNQSCILVVVVVYLLAGDWHAAYWILLRVPGL